MERKDYQKLVSRFGLGGLSVSKRRDIISENKFSYLRNVRVYSSGEIRPRNGQGTKINSSAFSATSIHTLRKFNDQIGATYKFIVGAGTSLYLQSDGAAASAALTTGMSGNKLRIAFARPNKSANTWAFIGDTTNRKLDINGNLRSWSILPLNNPIDVLVGQSALKVIDEFNATTGWAQGGTAGAPSAASNRINFTIPSPPSGIIYDTGSTGWANIVPAAMDSNFQVGALVSYEPGTGDEEAAVIDGVFEAVGSTTITDIRYDSGSSGLCTIQLATPTANLVPNCTIQLTNGGTTEYVRVISVVGSDINMPSFKCSTVGTYIAGSTAAGVRSYRSYFTKTHAAGDTVQSAYMTSAITTGTGTLTKTAALDLTQSTNLGALPFTDTDDIHISLRIDVPANITELKVQLDVDSATHDFTRNYYEYAVQPAAFTTAATTLTAEQLDLQRQAIKDAQDQHLYNKYTTGDQYDPYNSNNNYGYGPNYGSGIPIDVPYVDSNSIGVSDASTGTSQWTELVISLKDFTRVGSDISRGWKDIATLRITAIVTGNINLDLDSWYIVGGRNLYTDIGADYNWVVVPRNRNTGEQTLPSPPCRSGFNITHGNATLTITQSSDAQVTDYDFYRFGGTLLDWYYVGSATATTPSTSLSFIDNFPDEALQVNPRLSRDNYPVFPQLDQPRTGTATIKGNLLTRVSGDNYNTLWTPGLAITIRDSSNNSYYSRTYNSPTSTLMELTDTPGLTGTVTWVIDEPVLMAQPVRSIFGPYDNMYIFGCGSSLQAGTLFWTNTGDPCTSSLRNQLEITAPQEPLVGGCLYDGQVFVFSTERMFRIFQTGDPDVPFSAQEVANSKGLVSPSCLTVGQVIYFLGKDGLYASTGGQPYALTDRDLYPLFPHDSQAGETVNTISPPNYSLADQFDLRFHNDFLYFNYINTDAVHRTAVFDNSRNSGGVETDIDESGRWVSIDDYYDPVSLHYGEEGTSNPRLLCATTTGYVYNLNATADNTQPIPWQFETRSWDFKSPRNEKYISQIVVDHQLSGNTSIVEARLNLSSSLTSLSTFTSTARELAEIPFASLIPLSSMPVTLGLSFRGQTSASLALPKFFFLYIDYSEITPETSTAWYSQPTTNAVFGQQGWQHIRQAFIAYSSTSTMTFSIIADGITYTYTLASTSGLPAKVYVPIDPIKARIFQFTFTSSPGFRLYDADTELHIKSWGSPQGYAIIHPVSTL